MTSSTPDRARAWLAGVGGAGTQAELGHVRQVRRVLQAVVRGDAAGGRTGPGVVGRGLSWVPPIADGPIIWTSACPRIAS